MTFIPLVFSILQMESQDYKVIVADSATHVPLPHASIYDRHGIAIGISDNNGALPKIQQSSYPITLHYIGFNEKKVEEVNADTVFLSERVSDLPEVVVESRRHRMLHILAYVREYPTLASYTDTIFLFREKMVDYMVPSGNKEKFASWLSPRVLTSKSYYRFTNQKGLDSVSNVCQHHFSWSDWIGLVSKVSIPSALRNAEVAGDTLWGKYSAAEIWNRRGDSISIDIDVLANPASRRWVPNLTGFFNRSFDFDRFKMVYHFRNIVGDTISPLDLTRYSFEIDSKGRGHEMFRFNKSSEPYYVSTNADVYILDKEYINVSSMNLSG